jgi:hypothetical protein
MIHARTYRKYYFEASASSMLTDSLNAGDELAPGSKSGWRTLRNTGRWSKATLLLLLYALPFLLRWPGFTASWLSASSLLFLGCYGAVIVFAYLNHHLLIPEFYQRRRHLLYFFSVSFIGATLMAIAYSIEKIQATGRSFTLLYILVLFAAGVIIPLLLRLQRSKKQVEKQMADSQLRLMREKARNTIAGHILQLVASVNSDQAGEAEMLRRLPATLSFVQQDPAEGMTPLTAELDCIRNYIWLLKKANLAPFTVRSFLPVVETPVRVAALYFLSVVDFALSRERSGSDRPVNIEVRCFSDRCQLQVIFAKAENSITELTQSHWLAELRQQLVLQQPGSHELEILENENICSIKLTLPVV